jgi:hypothetical protein
MNTHGKVNVWIHVFLNSVLGGGERSASRPGRFTTGERCPLCALDRKLSGPQNRTRRRGEEEILDPTGTRTPTPRFTDCATATQFETGSNLLI